WTSCSTRRGRCTAGGLRFTRSLRSERGVSSPGSTFPPSAHMAASPRDLGWRVLDAGLGWAMEGDSAGRRHAVHLPIGWIADREIGSVWRAAPWALHELRRQVAICLQEADEEALRQSITRRASK